MLKSLYALFFCIVISNIVYANPPTANQMLDLCSNGKYANTEACDMFFGGFLEGLMSGTTIVDWNLPANQNLSAQTIKNSFITLLKAHPIMGDQPVGTVVTFSLVQQGALKEKSNLQK